MTAIYIIDNADYGEKTFYSSYEEAEEEAYEIYNIFEIGNELVFNRGTGDYEPVVSVEEFVSTFFKHCVEIDLRFSTKYGEFSSNEEILDKFIAEKDELQSRLGEEAYSALVERILRSPELVEAVKEKAHIHAKEHPDLSKKSARVIKTRSKRLLVHAAIGSYWEA